MSILNLFLSFPSLNHSLSTKETLSFEEINSAEWGAADGREVEGLTNKRIAFTKNFPAVYTHSNELAKSSTLLLIGPAGLR